MKTMNEEMDSAEQILYKTYNRFPVVFTRGDGVHLYDEKGTQYLDFFAGIAVQGLGHHYPGFDEALKAQVDKLIHISNYFYNEPAISAGEKLLKISQMDRVFFTNSGTEAIEGALKIARRYAYNCKDRECTEYIAMKNSFHGRSMGALSVTGNAHYREPFEPLIPGVKFADFNDTESVKRLVNEKTCGIIVEPIQGEGGIYQATDEFLADLRQICDANDLILIFDEIQCGMGRTGSYFAWQKSGVKPDVMAVAKALGNGVPIGAFLAAGKAQDALKPGDHGSTYGGNPLVCAAADIVLSIFEKDHIIEKAASAGDYLKEKLEKIKSTNSHIIDCRGRGLMLGLEFDIPVAPIVKAALLDEHLVLINAGEKIIRFVPPLIVTNEDTDEACDRLSRVLANI